MFPTPDHECINSNIEQLLFKWKGKLSGATLKAFENLQVHVRKGCLSGIPPSAGTAINGRLHRHLKRSMLCGASAISPELAVPILALVLYVWTCRRRGLKKHANNQRIVPAIPFEFGDLKETDGYSAHPLPFKSLAGDVKISHRLKDFVFIYANSPIFGYQTELFFYRFFLQACSLAYTFSLGHLSTAVIWKRMCSLYFIMLQQCMCFLRA